MSEQLHSREYRQRVLKEIITDLHQGASVEDVKARFLRLIKDIGPGEIANLEQALIEEGLPEQEIKRLCDVHVAVFRESLEQQTEAEEAPGHPIHTFRQENAAVSGLLTKLEPLLRQLQDADQVPKELWHRWHQMHQDLRQIERHYSRKENALFPYLEKYGISGPPGVMWSIHDDIRAQLKQIEQLLEQSPPAQPKLKRVIADIALPLLTAIKEMVYKEEKILFPMSLELLTEAEWKQVQIAGEEIGYTLIRPGSQWQPEAADCGATEAPQRVTKTPPGSIPLDVGSLTQKQLNQMLKSLPIDITFVDEHNQVRYYSQSPERIFTRTPAIIGRQVEKCHPPESVHVVEQIVADFKAKRRDSADFWLELGGKLIYIRYFPVRDDHGEYMGVLEVSQDVTAIRQLQGEKRLLDKPQD
jgi:PAS domain S-box-containing protein